ncbi:PENTATRICOPEPTIDE REPEAT-CONTAINING PROTEIN [Salix purpurea]|uniref:PENTATRICOPEPTIDE REPEAT-CONTAINING PROTEIN n=1 Tax=Salix purpurea TaxID=77065 RepID=A0A9Q0Q627_SALPP|nr:PENTATRICOPEPTIDE REPEAT-CONTAINING PROTEIN [Salix purpurea]
MLKGPKLAPPVSKTLQIFIKIQSASLFPSGFVRNFSVFNSKDNDSENETEWERLLKPYDLTELRRSFNQITPFQLCKLLELPLDVETSMEIFKWAGAQKGYCHSFSVYYLLIDKLGAAAGFKVIDRLLLQMKEEGIVFRESLFILIMKYYGRAGLPGQATRLLLDMKGVYCCEPSFRSYNAVLDVLVVGNCPSVASNVFYDMLNKGISPNDYTFGLVMKALCMVNEVDNACLLLRDMTKHGCVPNSVIYQTLIDALSKRDRVDEALKLLEEMFLMGCPPDVNTFNTVIYGRIDEAQTLLNKVPNPNVVHFNTFVNGFVRSGRLNEAMTFVYDKMINNGYVPDVHTFSTLVNGLCKKGLFGSAIELVNEMDAKGCKPNLNTYTILINGFCKKGQLEEAGIILREMFAKGLSLNTVGYNAVISALCKHGKVHEALDMFGEMSINKVTQSVRPSPMLSFRDRKVPSVLGRWNLFWPSELFFMKVAMTGFVLCLLVGFLDWIPSKLKYLYGLLPRLFQQDLSFLGVTPDEILGTKGTKTNHYLLM